MSGIRLMQKTIASNQNVIITISCKSGIFDRIINRICFLWKKLDLIYHFYLSDNYKSILQIFMNQQKSTKSNTK